MNLHGLNINALGDSITYGVGASCEENRYTDVFARLSGATVKNYGISGTRFARQMKKDGYTWNPNWDDNCFSDRIEKMDEEADALIIFGGTNDFGHGNAPFGTDEDREPDSFIGACHYLFATAIIKYPEAKIVVITPLKRATADEPSANSGRPLSDYRDKIVEIASYYGLYVIDAYNECPIDPRNEENRERYAPDGLHPSDEGHRLLAELILNHFDKM